MERITKFVQGLMSKGSNLTSVYEGSLMNLEATELLELEKVGRGKVVS